MRPSLLLTALLCGTAIGCGKQATQNPPEMSGSPPTQPASPLPVVVPPTPPVVPPLNTQEPKTQAPETPNPFGGKVSTVDLTPYKIRAVIDLPEGATIGSPLRGYLHIGYGKASAIGNSTRHQFDLEIGRPVGNFTFADAKSNAFRSFDKPIVHADIADRYFFQEGKDGLGQYKMGRTFTTGDQTYYIKFSCIEFGNELTKEKIQPLWKAIESIRQTEEQQKAEAGRTATFKKLLRKGEDPESIFNRTYFYGLDDDLVVSLKYEVINAKSVQLLKDIPDLYTVRLVGYEKFDQKLFQEILDLPTVRGVWLEGDWATDEVLAIVTANVRITDVTLVRADVTDKGFAKLEQLPKLRMVELQFCEKITPTATKLLRTKFPKLEFTHLR